MVRARRELERVAEEGRQENEAGKQEVARLRSEFAQEVAAMQQVQERQRTRVELDVGGVRHVTSVATLRSRPGSMLDALFSGRYNIEEEEGSGEHASNEAEQLIAVLSRIVRGKGGRKARGKQGGKGRGKNGGSGGNSNAGEGQRCTNCGGDHRSIECTKPVVDKAMRPCWVCHKT